MSDKKIVKQAFKALDAMKQYRVGYSRVLKNLELAMLFNDSPEEDLLLPPAGKSEKDDITIAIQSLIATLEKLKEKPLKKSPLLSSLASEKLDASLLSAQHLFDLVAPIDPNEISGQNNELMECKREITSHLDTLYRLEAVVMQEIAQMDLDPKGQKTLKTRFEKENTSLFDPQPFVRLARDLNPLGKFYSRTNNIATFAWRPDNFPMLDKKEIESLESMAQDVEYELDSLYSGEVLERVCQNGSEIEEARQNVETLKATMQTLQEISRALFQAQKEIPLPRPPSYDTDQQQHQAALLKYQAALLKAVPRLEEYFGLVEDSVRLQTRMHYDPDAQKFKWFDRGTSPLNPIQSSAPAPEIRSAGSSSRDAFFQPTANSDHNEHKPSPSGNKPSNPSS